MTLEERQREMRERKLGKKKRARSYRCWSQFGMANGDAKSLTQSSIPRWGMKIKSRGRPADD